MVRDISPSKISYLFIQSHPIINFSHYQQYQLQHHVQSKSEISQILIEHDAKVDIADKVRNWWLDEEIRNVGVLRWLIFLTTSHINILLSLFKYRKLIIFLLIFYHQLWDLIFRLDGLLSWELQDTMKLRLQKCWWKLELIHSWELIMWDQFPVLPFPFYTCRVKQQEIWQERRRIMILKECWRIMREILKDWKV